MKVELAYHKMNDAATQYQKIAKEVDAIENEIMHIAALLKVSTSYGQITDRIKQRTDSIHNINKEISKCHTTLEYSRQVFLDAEKAAYESISGIKLEEHKNIWDHLVDAGKKATDFVQTGIKNVSSFLRDYLPGGKYAQIIEHTAQLVVVATVSIVLLAEQLATFQWSKIPGTINLTKQATENWAYTLIGEENKIVEIDIIEAATNALPFIDAPKDILNVFEVMNSGYGLYSDISDFIGGDFSKIDDIFTSDFYGDVANVIS